MGMYNLWEQSYTSIIDSFLASRITPDEAVEQLERIGVGDADDHLIAAEDWNPPTRRYICRRCDQVTLTDPPECPRGGADCAISELIL